MIPQPTDYLKTPDYVGIANKYLRNRNIAVALAVINIVTSLTCFYLYTEQSKMQTSIKKANAEIVNLKKSQNLSNDYTDEAVSYISDRIDDLATCVNEYMDVVGDSGGYYYTYYYCN